MSVTGVKVYRRRITNEQAMVMVDFLEKYPKLVCNRARNGEVLWHVLAKKLNSVPGGVRKPSKLWIKTWQDKKSTLKKLLLKQCTERQSGMPLSHMQWTAVDSRIIRMLKNVGELNVEEAIKHHNEKTAPYFVAKVDEDDSVSVPSHASSPTLPDGEYETSTDRYEDIEYLDTAAPFSSEEIVQIKDGAKIKKIRSKPSQPNMTSQNHSRDSDDHQNPLQTEWSRVASMEEQRIQIEQKNCLARKETSDALKQCASAMESLAKAVCSQGSVISEALKAQGQVIAEALKEQGRMIAEALEKR